MQRELRQNKSLGNPEPATFKKLSEANLLRILQVTDANVPACRNEQLSYPLSQNLPPTVGKI